MMHPHTELRFIDAEIGHGVFATRPILRGTITWALDEFDQVLSPQRVASLLPAQREQVEEFAYVDQRGDYVLCWDWGRYVNHGCDPTSRGVGNHFEIAVRDIAAGEQLTSDYAELNITAAFACRCGAANCRGVVRADEVLRRWQEWDAVVAAAVPSLKSVPQPLWSFVESDTVLQAILTGQSAVPSRRHYRAFVSAASSASGATQGSETGSESASESVTASKGLWRLDPAAASLKEAS